MAKAVGGSGKKKGPNYVEIPAEIWRRALNQAQALEGMGPYSCNAMKECPYHSTHRVSASKFESHLAKCRSNYRQQVVARGDMVNTRSCKYNHRHQLLPPELLHHEERCEDRHFTPSYMLYLNPWFNDELEKLEYDLEKYEMDAEELQRMRDGLYLDQFIGGASIASHRKPIPFEDIVEGDSAPNPGMLQEGFSSPFEWADFPVGDLRPQQYKKEPKGPAAGSSDQRQGSLIGKEMEGAAGVE